MTDAGILDGDLVVVEDVTAKRAISWWRLSTVQFTLKRLDVERGRFVLKPENKAYPLIRPEGTLEIFGVMVGFESWRRQLFRRLGSRQRSGLNWVASLRSRGSDLGPREVAEGRKRHSMDTGRRRSATQRRRAAAPP